MTRADAWNACKAGLEGREVSVVVYQRPDGTGRVVYGSREAGGFVELEVPAGYDEFELAGRISARLEGKQWDGQAYLAGVEREQKARYGSELDLLAQTISEVWK